VRTTLDSVPPTVEVRIEGALSLGPFALSHKVGQGGLGSVWLAHHRSSATPVALKVLNPRFAGLPATGELRNEVRAMASLDHPNIMRVYDMGRLLRPFDLFGQVLPARTPWLAMEYEPGGSALRLSGRIDWPTLRRLLEQLLAGLAHAHARGLLHRDIKAGNVLVSPDERHFSLTDFGIACRLGRLEDTSIAGTPAYMSPEQFNGDWRSYGPWTDLYSVGCLTRALIHGVAPCDQETATDTDATPQAPLTNEEGLGSFKGPRAFPAWVRWLTQREISDRPQAAAHALDALAALGPTSPTPRRTGLARPDWLSGEGLSVFHLREAPLVGREQERTILRRAWARVTTEGRARAVVLRGAAGVGKSRLARWLSEQVHEHGQGLRLAAHHAELPGADEGIEGGLRTELRVVGLDRPHLTQWAKRWLASLGEQRSEAHLVELLLPADAESRQSLSEGARRRELERTLRRYTQGKPLLIWLDDLHWGVESIRWAADFLAAQPISPSPVLLLATIRDEALAELPDAAEALSSLLSRSDVQTLHVAPLQAQASKALARRLLGFSGAVTTTLAERTAGNPLFLIQLVADWAQRGVLTPRGGCFTLQDEADTRIPANLRIMFQARLERMLLRLGPPGRLALQRAALLGRRVVGTEWRAACEDAAPACHEVLDRLLHARLAVRDPNQDCWEFVHGIVRETLEAGLADDPMRHTHHLACAEAMRGTNEDWRARRRLAGHLARGGATDEAAHIYLSLTDPGQDPALPVAPIAATEALVREARALCTDSPVLHTPRARAGLDLTLAWSLFRSGLPTEAQALSAEVRRRPEVAKGDLLRRAFQTEAAIRRYLVDRAGVLALIHEVAAIARHTDDPRLQYAVDYERALLLRVQGRISEALGAFDRALSPRALQVLSKRLRSVHEDQVCNCLFATNDLDACIRRAQAALAAYAGLDDYRLSKFDSLIAHAYELKGDLPNAAKHFRRCLEATQDAGEDTTSRRFNLARVQTLQGGIDEGLRTVRELRPALAARDPQWASGADALELLCLVSKPSARHATILTLVAGLESALERMSYLEPDTVLVLTEAGRRARPELPWVAQRILALAHAAWLSIQRPDRAEQIHQMLAAPDGPPANASRSALDVASR
jgi:serine/threonine protein kinase/tetratricopeptide (TPR) repeat protein